jgi:hypothetical protein
MLIQTRGLASWSSACSESPRPRLDGVRQFLGGPEAEVEVRYGAAAWGLTGMVDSDAQVVESTGQESEFTGIRGNPTLQRIHVNPESASYSVPGEDTARNPSDPTAAALLFADHVIARAMMRPVGV